MRTGLTTTKTLFYLNSNSKTIYLMICTLPLSCTVLLPSAVLEPRNKYGHDSHPVRAVATSIRRRRPRWPKGKRSKTPGTIQNMGRMPQPSILMLQTVYKRLICFMCLMCCSNLAAASELLLVRFIAC